VKASDPQVKAVPIALGVPEIMGHFGRAISVVVVCQRSLAGQELLHAGDEDEALLEAITMLRRAYNELDVLDAYWPANIGSGNPR
jgi:hypothetical protein